MTIAIIVMAGLLGMGALGGLVSLAHQHAEHQAAERAERQAATLTIITLAGQVTHLTMALECQEEENEYLRVKLEQVQERYDALAGVMAEGLTQKEARG